MEDQRARLHIVRGTARSGQGDRGGMVEIERGISVAQEAGVMDMVATGYANLTSTLNYLGRLPEAKAACDAVWRVAHQYGLGRFIGTDSADVAGWEYLEGRWDDAVATCDARFVAIDKGETLYSDGAVMSLRAWMRLARGDDKGANEDSSRAAEFARTSDVQAQATSFSVRASIALALGREEEAHAVASEVIEWGSVLPGRSMSRSRLWRKRRGLFRTSVAPPSSWRRCWTRM